MMETEFIFQIMKLDSLYQISLKGAIYLAESPHTGLHEVFQKNEIIDSHDLATNCMAEIEIRRSSDFKYISACSAPRYSRWRVNE